MGVSPSVLDLVFVVGCPRSGTTWLRRVFDRHPAVVSAPESHIFPELYSPIAHHPADRATAAVLANFDEVRAGRLGGAGLHHWIDRSTLEALLEELLWADLPRQESAWRVVEAVFTTFFERSARGENRLIVEKTPYHLFYSEAILRRWPTAKIIEVVRDGRDVCVSLQHMADLQSWAPSDRAEQISKWTRSILHGMEVRSLPIAAGRWQVMRFEDMHSDPVGQIRRLFEFVDLDFTDESVGAIAVASAFDQIPEDQRGERQFFRRGEVGDWRNHFTEEDIELFEELAGDALRAAGYARDEANRAAP